MDEESRGRSVTNLIRTLSPEIGVQILPADVRVVTRRPPRPNAAAPTALSGTRLPTTTGGLTEADMWLHMAEGLLQAYDQPEPSEAATYQPAATLADVLALARVRAWAEYEADTDADDAVICPPTHTLLALLEVREWLTDTMTAAGVEMYHHHTEPTLLRVGDDNL
eukprot:jgi/Tetstr1/463465/TSEL_008357.t1